MSVPDPIALTRRLIDVPSVTGEEGAVAELIESLLTEAGFECRRFHVGENRFNLLATTTEPPVVLLSSHIDTVPPFIASGEDAEFIRGRGACDTKGIIAAMIAAGIDLLGRGEKRHGFLFVVGEETDSIGAKKANDDLASLGSRYLVNGEPTGSKFVRASKGAMTAIARFRGKAGHSAYPESGDSAIVKLARAVAAIAEESWGHDSNLGDAVANVGMIRGGVKPNVIAAEAECEMMFRTVEPWQEVRSRLESFLERYDADLVYSHGNDPTFMHVPDGRESIVVGFNTDVPHLSRLGKPILFGPGSILDAHSADEKIAKRDVTAAVETYRDLVLTLLAE